MKVTGWLGFALSSTLLWGVWGAFAGLPTKNGFPETLIYVVWALTMIPPAIFAMYLVNWKLKRDLRSVTLGLIVGLLGAGGQLVLFYAVKQGPTYLIFPIISMSPAVTIALSFFVLKERTGKFGALGILFALCALPLFDYSPSGSASVHYGVWFVLAFGVLLAWGIQAFFIKLANATMDAESIFFYMALGSVLTIPVALAMTDFTQPINTGFNGPYLAAIIQILNAVGALLLVYAFRKGKALVVSPMVNAGAPLLTTLIALSLAGSMPSGYKLAGIALSLCAALLLALQPEESESVSLAASR
jgi:uncharacterized membrane protein